MSTTDVATLIVAMQDKCEQFARAWREQRDRAEKAEAALAAARRVPREPTGTMVEAGTVKLRFRLGTWNYDKVAVLTWMTMYDAWAASRPEPAAAPDVAALIAELQTTADTWDRFPAIGKAIAALLAQQQRIAELEKALDDNWVTHQRVVKAEAALAAQQRVPREPTEAMIKAGVYALYQEDNDVAGPRAVIATFHAMWDAAGAEDANG